MESLTNKCISMTAAVDLIPPGEQTLALSGNALHRAPLAFVRALAFRNDISLHLAKTAAAYDVDLLCLAGVVKSVAAGFVGYESEFGMARHYRKAVEAGRVRAEEHACYTLITAFRAAAYGLPFLPVHALEGSDLVEARGFKKIQDPYGDASFPAIPAIRPDFAIIHVQYADILGNGVILGPKYEDGIMVRAAKSVILCAERIVESKELPVPIDHVDIPSPLVDAVVETPKGAWPGSCYAEYEVDAQGVRAFQLMEDSGELRAYLESLQ